MLKIDDGFFRETMELEAKILVEIWSDIILQCKF